MMETRRILTGRVDRWLTEGSLIGRYLGALLLTVLAVGATLAVPVLRNDSPFVLSFGAIVLTAWYAGFGPALVVIVGTTLGVSLTGQATSFWSLLVADALRLGVFSLVAAGITTLASTKRETAIALQSQNRRLEAVHRLSLRVSRGDPIAQIYDAALAVAHDVFGTTRGAVVIADEDGIMRTTAQSGDPFAWELDVERIWSNTVTPPESVCIADLLEPDDRRIDEALKSGWQRDGVRGIGWFPVTIRGGLAGALVVCADDRHEFNLRHIQLGETITTHLAYAVERHQADRYRDLGEQQLRFALQSAKMGTWRYDVDAHRVYWSPEVERIHGLQPGSFEGTFDAFLKDIHPDDRDRVQKAIATSLDEQTDHDVEYRIVLPTGEVRWIAGKGRVLLRDGRPAQMSGVCMEITARKETEEQRQHLLQAEQRARVALEEAHNQASFLAEASAILGASLDHETTLSGIARAAVPRIADWCAVDLLERDGQLRRLAVAHVDPAKVEWANEVQARFPPDPEAPRGVFHVLKTGRSEFYPEISEEQLVASARSPEHLELLRALGTRAALVVPLIARHRRLGVLTLVTAESGRLYTRSDLLLAEELARRAAMAVDNATLFRELQEASRAKDEFLATVSHELRTPLNAILGWATVLRAGAVVPDQQAQALATIERNATVLTQLVQDVLDASRIVTGQLAFEPKPLQLETVVDAALEAIRPVAAAKGVMLDQRTIDGPIPSVSGDSARLQQVVWNLVSNAVKFTPSGGQVQIRMMAEDGDVVVQVVDSGQGIAKDFLPFVFDRFRQADGSTTRQHGGLGLGLAIVRHLVELHGGTVAASSEGTGRGATFTVRLPSVSHTTAGTDALDKAPEQPARFLEGRPLAGCRVLAVDDDHDARELVGFLLTSAGAELRSASSAEEAMESLEEWQPHLVVLDIGMPNEDGYTLLRRVHGRFSHPDTAPRTVAVTAHAGQEHRIRALAAGFDAYVSKPVDPPAFVDELRQLWRQPRAQHRMPSPAP